MPFAIDSRHRNLDHKRIETHRLPVFGGAHPNFQPFHRKIPRFQILRRIIARTGSERDEQKFRRAHSLIGPAIAGRLVANNAMPARFGLELHTVPVSNRNIHKKYVSTHEDAVWWPG